MSKHVVDDISRNSKCDNSNVASNVSYEDCRIGELTSLTYGDVHAVLLNSCLGPKDGKVGYVREDVMQSVLEPDSSSKRLCYSWLRKYCKEYADYDPTDNVYYACVDTKLILFEEYTQSNSVELARKSNIKSVCKREFYETWLSNFPHLKLRDKCNICGKCCICMHMILIMEESRVEILLS